MMNLPNSTIVNRFIPKEKFYSKTTLSSKLRQQFRDEIEKITWTNKISPDTLNITANDYAELQIFEITLKGNEVSTSILGHIDKYIPYPILFIIKKSGTYKASISFKENATRNQNTMKVDTYFNTGWQQNLDLELKGRSVDEIYKNYLYQIAPELRHMKQVNAREAVELNKSKQLIQNQIESLRKQINTELSTAKKQELARQRFELEQQLNDI